MKTWSKLKVTDFPLAQSGQSGESCLICQFIVVQPQSLQGGETDTKYGPKME